MLRRLPPLILAIALGGCSVADLLHRAPPPPPNDAASPPDRDAAAALVLGDTFQAMQRLSRALPAEQAELLADARVAYERAPHGTVQLRYALLLATPGQLERDAPKAEGLLRDLVAAPETLMPVERAVALIELAQLDRELGLAADEQRLQGELERTLRDRDSASQKRQLEAEENARLRRQLEDAQAKLDAVTDIERNLPVRKPANQGTPK